MALPQDLLVKRSATPVGNFDFDVKILGVGTEIALDLPVESVKGISDGRTSIIRHRPNGFSATTQTPYPGLTTPDAVTLEGSWFYDAGDLIKLQEWRQQVKGKLAVSEVGGYFRDILIAPSPAKEDGNLLGLEGARSLRLVNAVAVRLSIADFDINAPAVSNWSLEIEFEDMVVQ